MSKISANILSVCLLVGSLSTLPAADLSSDAIYDKSRILNVEIEIAEQAWKDLCNQSRDARGIFSGKVEDPFTYFEGNITIDGTTIKAVGIRKKGFIGSLDNEYPSLKIKFNEFVEQKPFKDLEGLTLNNNKQDTSLVSQTLAYETFNAAGVIAPRCSFAKVTVNGKYLGIYSNVESIAKPMLDRRFKNSNGNLYEGTLADLYPRAIDRMEVKANKKQHDRSRLDRLASLLCDDEKLDIKAINELVDVDNFLRYWAVESLIGFWDGYTNNQNNYWLYENKINGKFYFMPWGADAAFMPSGFPGFGPRGALSVYAESILANRLIQDESVATRYRDTMKWILENAWKETELIERIDKIEKLLEGNLHSRQGGASRSMQSVRQFITRRRKMIEQELEVWPVRVPPFARKPMYVMPIGSAIGSLKTDWSTTPAGKIPTHGEVEIKLTIDDELVEFETIGVSLHPAPRRNFGGFGPPIPPGPPQVEIVMEGIRSSDKKLSRLTMTLPEEQLTAAGDKSIELEGFYVPDSRATGFGMPAGGRSISGTIKFSKDKLKPGDAVEATIDLKLSEVRGGFMNRSRVEPGKK